MKLSAALQLLEQGREIRQQNWSKGEYLYNKNELVLSSNLANTYRLCVADNWEEYIPIIKAQDLKVGDKFKHPNGYNIYVVVPDALHIFYPGSRDSYLSNHKVVVQINTSILTVFQTPNDSDVVLIKE